MIKTSHPLEDPEFATNLARTDNPVALVRNTLKSAQLQLKEAFDNGTPVAKLVHRRAEILDELLRNIWRRTMPEDNHDIALVAVGGYGRGELHPGSDIDLQILVRPESRDALRVSIEKFITYLWDIGLEAGQSVRTVAECAEEAAKDITVVTNLMECRWLAGSSELFESMQNAVGPENIWPSPRFFQAKLLEQVSRHHKYHDTAYNLEPNIKEGPGGLRDIQIIAWVAKRHFGAKALDELVEHRFLTAAEYAALAEGQEFLWRIRFALHSLTGRREDRLLFDHQRTLAEQFGYRDSGSSLGVEQFMKRYYRTVMELSRLNEMLLQLFEEAILYVSDPGVPTIINKRFQSRKGFIEVRNDGVFSRYPFAMLEIFLLLQQHPELKGVRATTIRLLRNHTHLIDDKFRQDLRHRSLFMEILRQARGVTEQLRRMNRYGVLAAYLPAFGHIVGMMQYDLFHVYTVDEHTLTVVRNLRRFAYPEYTREFTLCSELMQNHIPKQEILTLAALFHDIAKGRGGDHSELGEQESIDFCLHHGMSQYDARLVAWLVRNHLIMSMTSQRKDISDPEVITEFAMTVRSPQRLNYLYLLTVADIRGTNPDLWNSWKDTLLLELYTATMRVLRRGLENPIDQAEQIEETRNEALQLLTGRNTDVTTIDQLWREFYDDYFLRYSADEIAWHTEAILNMEQGKFPMILIRHKGKRGGTEIFIHTMADDRLFARTTQVLDQLGLNIVDARIIGARNGLTLDTYTVLEDTGQPIGDAHRELDIYNKLQQCLTDLDRDFTVTRRQPRLFKHFAIPTEIDFSNDERDHRTIVEVMTVDRPGLLSRVGQALIECGIRLHNAKITTFGARVEDTFFITDKDNKPLTDEVQFECLRHHIVRYLDTPGQNR
ncbi:MAG: [protein-PII] uridylyltransferase [Gammaproteobacteria bacterium]